MGSPEDVRAKKFKTADDEAMFVVEAHDEELGRLEELVKRYKREAVDQEDHDDEDLENRKQLGRG